MKTLFFAHPGTNSRDILLDMAAGFRKAGAEVLVFELGPIWQAQQRDATGDMTVRRRQAEDFMRLAASIIQSNQVDFSVGMWANAPTTFIGAARDGKPCTFFDAIGSPHLLFWLDAPHWAHQGSLRNAFPSPMFNSPWLLHLINNEGTARDMTQVLGFSNVLSQPYGVNEDVFRPRPEVAVRFDLVFGIGPGDPEPSPLMIRELASDDPDVTAIREAQALGVRPRLQTLAGTFEAPLRDSMIEVFEHLLQSQLRSRDLPMLDRLRAIAASDASLAAAIQRWLVRPSGYLEASSMLREIDHWERAFTITWLSRRFACAVFGSPSIDAWDCQAHRLGQLPYAEQAAAYASGRLALNVMRWQDDVGTNIKPFEVASCAVPCLMSHRATLDQHFGIGTELLSFRTLRQAAQLATSLIEDPARREAVGQAGRARVLRDHTWTARARSLMTAIQARHPAPRPADRHKPAAAMHEAKPAPAAAVTVG